MVTKRPQKSISKTISPEHSQKASTLHEAWWLFAQHHFLPHPPHPTLQLFFQSADYTISAKSNRIYVMVRTTTIMIITIVYYQYAISLLCSCCVMSHSISSPVIFTFSSPKIQFIVSSVYRRGENFNKFSFRLIVCSLSISEACWSIRSLNRDQELILHEPVNELITLF